MQARADPLIREMRRFALGSLRASAAIFYWIDGEEMRDAELTGFSQQHFARYRGEMHRCDPLSIGRLAGQGQRVATLAGGEPAICPDERQRYRSYLREAGVVDVLDFLFWRDGQAFAGLGILKTASDPAICADTLAFARSMQPYLEFNLSSHPRLREAALAARLQRHYRLTTREVEVAGLVRCGCINEDVGQELGISLSTVKTHLARIFVKLAVENRAALVRRLDMIAES